MVKLDYNIPVTIAISLPSIFKGSVDYTYTAINVDDIYKKFDIINEAKKTGLNYLERDLRYNKMNIPVTVYEEKKLVDVPSRYSNFFETDSRYLKVATNSFYNAFLNVDQAFLGSEAMMYNMISFDPRPNIIIAKDSRPLYPGYDPIYYKTKKEDILEHIYTTMYPTNKITEFPDFRIGDYIINGSLYNPMLDLRNYRLFGSYNKNSNFNTQYNVFQSKSISLIENGFVRGRYFKAGEKYYYIQRNNLVSAASLVSVYKNKYQYVLPSLLSFKEVTKLEFDLNSDLVILKQY
jgi:hypothetical protein